MREVLLWKQLKECIIKQTNTMTQEDKELLLKDLCARLPYGVMIQHPELFCPSRMVVEKLEGIDREHINDDGIYIEHVKPYLRPMFSMTEEEIKELSKIDEKRLIFSARHLTFHLDGEVIDYLSRKMFDYRGLIKRGLAIEAPEGMYN